MCDSLVRRVSDFEDCLPVLDLDQLKFRFLIFLTIRFVGQVSGLVLYMLEQDFSHRIESYGYRSLTGYAIAFYTLIDYFYPGSPD